jgi:hypothetical protein
MPVKVFISHKQEDAAHAAYVASYLKLHGLDVYLDTIDRQLIKDGPDLAEYLRKELDKCTQLLAIISRHTTASWWVPWEIGVATEKERFLASYVSDAATIPEYLQKWPYLRTNADLDAYIRESKNSEALVEDRILKGYSGSARSQGFRSFHTSLRASLGQAS